MHAPRMACCSSLFAFFILTFILWSGVPETVQAAEISHSCTHDSETFYYLCPATITDTDGNVHTPPVLACGYPGDGSFRNSTVCVRPNPAINQCNCDHPDGCYSPCDPTNAPNDNGDNGDNGDTGESEKPQATPPSVPLGLTATPGDGEVMLNWQAPKDNDDAPQMTVEDARAAEDAGVLVFSIRLNAPSDLPITVDYATSDGTATAGEDYMAAGGSLSFMPGDIERTISVLLQEDGKFEADETFVVTLSNAVNAHLADGAATGTIADNDDASPVAQAWLSRFGRTVATQVVDTLESRFYGAFTDESSVSLGGMQMRPGLVPALLDEQALGWNADMAFIHGAAWTDADRQLSGAWSPDMRRWLSTSSFHWTSAAGAGSSANGGLAGAASGGYGPWGSTAARITYWGRGALTEFDGRDGDITLDGEVLTGILASDYEDERLLAGLALGYSDGDGSYRTSGTEGSFDASLVSIYPYARLEITDNISVWAVLGYGTGDMKMTTDSGEATVDTDIEMKLGVMGIRGVLLSTETLDVALKSDAFLVSMDADATEGIESPLDTDVGRVRLLLEGSHSRTLSGGGILRPAVELGLRYDDSDDAETGFGVELGGALRYSDPARGVTMEAKARTLLAHEDGDYEEWGVGGYLHLDPSAAEQGFWLRLDSSWGVLADGENRLWAHQNTSGLASDTYTNPTGRLNLELGYAMDVPGSYGVLIPYSALELTGDDNRTYRLGWRYKLGESLYMSLDGARRERYDVSPDHGLILRTTLPW